MEAHGVKKSRRHGGGNKIIADLVSKNLEFEHDKRIFWESDPRLHVRIFGTFEKHLESTD